MQHQYYILKGIGPEGIQLKPDPYDDSQGDGKVWHNDELVGIMTPIKIANNYIYVSGVEKRSIGYIDTKHLYPRLYQDSSTMRWYSTDSNGKSYWLGGLRRRKFRSHKKHHVKSRPRSKKSCSRRR